MTSLCASCGATILWVRFASGKNSPMDATPVAAGNVTINPEDGLALVVSAETRAYMEKVAEKLGRKPPVYYQPHWSTCPGANSYRRRGRR